MLNKLFHMDDSHEFKPLLAEIEDNPASPHGTFMFWTIVSIIVITILWLFLAKVDVVVSARGEVIPEGEVKILQPLDTGVVQKILVKEGDFVKKDQPLMEIDPSTTEPALESAQKNLDNTKLEIKRLNATSNGTSFSASGGDTASTQEALYQSSLSSMYNQISAKNIELLETDQEINATNSEQRMYKTMLASYLDKEKSYKKLLDFIAKDEYVKLENDIENAKSNIERLHYKLMQFREQKNKIRQEMAYLKEQFRVNNLKELVDKQKLNTELQANLDTIKFRNSKQILVSPVDGYVDKLFIHTLGGVVSPAEKLISITPSNTPLLIKAIVKNEDIGFIKQDMPVSIKVDTFSFQKYGLLEGKIKTISKSSIQEEKLGPVYEVYVLPITKSLMVEGQRESISTGMTVSAEIKVGKRRVIEFFIYPLIKYFNESISVR